ncbi:MAG: NrfD/PsrC family molybdoenzyme membrane anchor subunit, partial [Acidobacteriota bacterium]
LILSIVTLAGIWVVLNTLLEGHIHSNTTQHVPWGLWVALYIYFLGISEGSFLLSTLVYVFGVKRLEAVGPLALLQALGCVLLGGFLVVMDLGHPFRVYMVLTSFNPTSVMSWMGLFYNFYILIVLVALYLALRPELVRNVQIGKRPAWLYRCLSLGSTDLGPTSLERDARWLRILGILGIPVAIIVCGGVGALFAVAKARPNWFSGLFPIIFLVSALVSGGALLTFLSAVFSKRPREQKLPLLRDLARLTIGILCFELLLLVSEILVTFYGYVPFEVTGWSLTLFGPYWWVFWFVQLLIGAVVPIVIVLTPKWNSSIQWLGLAGFLVAFGILGARLNIVIPPLIAPALGGMPEAYHHFRNAVGYFPSLQEWLVAVFAFALGTWLLLGAVKVLPLEPTGGKSQ